ncbi:MAG: hypothetical protein KC457_16665, partial [Myxococcales bacterium]|nr:hypothetical protein [Myxococcales bacterium]
MVSAAKSRATGRQKTNSSIIPNDRSGDYAPAVRDPLQLRRPPGPVRATLRAPGSKSISNRALLAAAMADGT